ncbi:MAG: hypothetical protein ACTSQL_11785 [Promethearchaeota archaeon]
MTEIEHQNKVLRKIIKIDEELCTLKLSTERLKLSMIFSVMA